MSATKEFTYSDVSEHASKKDLYIVVHDKVYDCTSFVDEHPYVSTSATASTRPHPTLGRPRMGTRTTHIEHMKLIDSQRW